MLTENTEAAVQLNFLALALGSALAAHVEVRPPFGVGSLTRSSLGSSVALRIAGTIL